MANTRNRRFPDLLDTVAAVLGRHLPLATPSRLLLGLSGGVDSVVLLHLLCRLRAGLGFELAALHVHHGLSPNADAWVDFCRELCHQCDVPLDVEAFCLSLDAGQGIEAAARAVRYEAYARHGTEWVLLAQHRDDQAETLLLNLLRGAGVQGAAAMPECRPFRENRTATHDTSLLRPLLTVPRAALEAYAAEHGLAWIEDESNLDTRYSRNFLRADILPALKSRFPGCDVAFARAASHFAEGAELLDDLAELDLARAAAGTGIAVAALAELSPARARNLLRYWLRKLGTAMPDTETLTEALHQLLTAGAEAAVAVKVDEGVWLRRFRGVAYRVAAPPEPQPLRWQGEAKLPWGDGSLLFHRENGAGISALRLGSKPVSLRMRQAGDRLRPHAKRPSRSLKNLLQESAIPPWQRDYLPFLCCGEELVWVAGLGIAADWQCGAAEEGLVVAWAE